MWIMTRGRIKIYKWNPFEPSKSTIKPHYSPIKNVKLDMKQMEKMRKRNEEFQKKKQKQQDNTT